MAILVHSAPPHSLPPKYPSDFDFLFLEQALFNGNVCVQFWGFLNI